VDPGDRIRETRALLLQDGVVLCVRLARGAALLELCRAAMRGGLRVLEITLTTPGAIEAIATLAKEGESLVGAGTVLTTEELRAVAAAGGRFAFSPVVDAAVMDEAARLGLLAVPGAGTSTEILAARRHGAEIVKVFPAAALGGPAFLRAVRGPFPEVSLLPTSGPTAENLGEYFAAGACAVGVGGEVFHEGCTPASVEAAAKRMREAADAARAGAEATAPRVRVTPIPVAGGIAEGVSCSWEGGQYVGIVARRGLVACGIFDGEVCERFGFAVALAHGTPASPLVEPADVLTAVVDTVSSAARHLGIEPGMKGAEAVALMMK
jgi:2-dehydro-3-deoxyphosphogluconate aldolase/(4S)-4-hydroxy-2-oxoglutarate aldolase